VSHTEVYRNRKWLLEVSTRDWVVWWRCISDIRRQTGSDYSTRKMKRNVAAVYDIKQWTKLDTCKDIKRLAEERYQ